MEEKKMKRKRIKKKNDGMHGKLESWPSNRLLVRACETMRAKSVKTGLWRRGGGIGRGGWRGGGRGGGRREEGYEK